MKTPKITNHDYKIDRTHERNILHRRALKVMGARIVTGEATFDCFTVALQKPPDFLESEVFAVVDFAYTAVAVSINASTWRNVR